MTTSRTDAPSGQGYSPLLAALWTLGLLGLAVFAPRPSTDNSVDALMASDAPAVATYREFQAQFGSDELVVVRLEGGRPFDRFRLAATLTATLTNAPAMRGVLSTAALHPEATTVIVDEVFGGPQVLQEKALSLHGPVAEALSLWAPETAHVYGLAEVSSPETRAELWTALNQLRRDGEELGIRMLFTGPPFLNLALDRAGRRTEAIALPLLLIVAILVLIVTAGIRATIALLIPVGLTVLAVDGVFALGGGVSNLLVNIAKPLLFVVGLASAVHVLTEARQMARPSPWRAARAKRVAVITALITTAIGFGSLGLSEVAPIRAFGLLAGAGLVAMIPAILLSVPWLLSRLDAVRVGPGWSQRTSQAVSGVAHSLVSATLRAPYIAPTVAVVVIAAGIWVLPALPAEPHAIRYLAADHPLRKDQTAMEAAGLGVATVEVVLAAPGITGTDLVAPLRAFARSAADLPGVAASVGWPHLVDQTRVATGRAAVDDWVIAQLEAQTTAATFGSKDRARIALIVQTIDADDLDALKAALRRLAKTHVPTAKLTITGNYDLLLHAQDALLETIQVSLLWTTILMQLALMIVLRSLRIGLLALIPNLFPVALNLVAMKLLGIPLDIGTSMTAAIALGIAVDDTLHFTLAAKANGLMASNNLRASARAAAVAIVISSLVIGLGFAALLSSDFIPTRRFGGLCGLAMLSALAADLLVLPPLLRWATRAVEPK